MTLRIPFANDAKQYDFGYLRHLAETLLNSEGVANYATDFVVTNAATGLRVDIAAGAAWVKGDSGTPAMGISQGLFSVVNDAAVANAVTLPAAHASNPRLDQIVLKVRDSADLGSGADDAIFDYVQGTPTSGATLLNRTGAAALPNDCLLLADVLVPAAATNLVAANVRDRRLPANGRATRAIATAESTTSATYVELATPDQVHVYVPQDCPVLVHYTALGKIATAAGQTALHITDVSTMTAVQLKATAINGVPVVQECGWTQPWYNLVTTTGVGLASTSGNTADSSEVTTGLVASSGLVNQSVGAMPVYGLPAGVYNFSIRHKANATGTVFQKNRRLSVAVMGQGRSA